MGLCHRIDNWVIHRGKDYYEDSLTEISSTIDLCGLKLPQQITRIDQALKSAACGSDLIVLTDQRMVATYVLPKALSQGVRCKVSPSNGNWEIMLALKK